jgi:prepilin-type N-terminal cleavage/methylation domain-containing protein
MAYKLKQQGFTIVELLIVIVVIGILAALVITTFTGIQQKARDTERTTDIKALHGQVEAFYAQKGFYPSLTDLNGSAWRTANMKGLDGEALKDPKGSAQTLVATPAANSYAYAVTNAAGTTCEADDTTCAKYTLTSTNEGTPATFVKTSLN